MMLHDHAFDSHVGPDRDSGDSPSTEKQHGDATGLVTERALERARSRHRLNPQRTHGARHTHTLTPLHVRDRDARRPELGRDTAAATVPGVARRRGCGLASPRTAASIRGVELVEHRADSAITFSEVE